MIRKTLIVLLLMIVGQPAAAAFALGRKNLFVRNSDIRACQT